MLVSANAFRRHWMTYVEVLEGRRQAPTRSMLVVLSILSLYHVLNTSLYLLGVAIPAYRVTSDWWSVFFLAGIIPEGFRTEFMVTLFAYLFCTFLGISFELLRSRKQVLHFMSMFTTTGQDKLSLASQDKFELMLSRGFRFLAWSLVFLQAMCFLVIAGCILLTNAWWIDKRLCLFWLILGVAINISCVYVLSGMSMLLILFAYYIILWQQDTLHRFGFIESRRLYRRCRRFEALVVAYVSLNQLLTQSNKFWSFYLSIYLNLFPMLIVYFCYLISKHVSMMMSLTGVTLSFLLQLLFLLYACSSVTRNNRTISKRVTRFYRTQLEPNLNGVLRLYLHLDNMVDNVRLSNYAFSTIDSKIIDRRTYFLVLFKFIFVYIKVLCNKNFN